LVAQEHTGLRSCSVAEVVVDLREKRARPALRRPAVDGRVAVDVDRSRQVPTSARAPAAAVERNAVRRAPEAELIAVAQPVQPGPEATLEPQLEEPVVRRRPEQTGGTIRSRLLQQLRRPVQRQPELLARLPTRARRR